MGMNSAAEYVRSFKQQPWGYIGIPAPSSVTGNGYAVGWWSDGAVLRVGDSIVEHLDRPCSVGMVDVLAKVGRLLTGLAKATRAAQLQELGCKPGATMELAGTVWNSDGDYVGLV